GINALQHKKKKRGVDISDIGKKKYTLYDLIAQLADSDDEESEVESEGGYSDEFEENRVGGEEENEEGSDEDDDESEEEEKNEDWLYDLLVELYEAQEREKGSGDSQSEEESDVEDEIEEVETDDEHDKIFFVATLFNNKKVKEEIPAKCEDPGLCLVTCKIKHAIVRECLCDPGACSSMMSYELYKFLGLGPLTKTSCTLAKYGASDLCPELTNSIGSPLSPGQTCCHQVPKHMCHVAVVNLVRSRNCHYASRGVGRIALRD
ncbi:hypothetical protein PIB30_038462, partial [Stylosanthes scabra]|nr:hypothetical protein [Stylosanthes scabra]